MPIHADEVLPLLVAAVPSFAEKAPEPDDDGTRIHYEDAGEFARHLVDMIRLGAHDELRRAFDVVEAMHVDGDEFVRELATIGYLEGLQNICSHATDVSDTDLEPYLGPESRRRWDGLNDFWAGRTDAVNAIEDDQ